MLTASVVYGVQQVANTMNIIHKVLANCSELSFSDETFLETFLTYKINPVFILSSRLSMYSNGHQRMETEKQH